MVIANYFLRTWVLIELNTSLSLLPTLSKHSEFDCWYIPFMKLLSCAVDISGLCCAILSHFSHVWLFVTLWTVAHQVPLSMGFSRQEYWSGLPCPPPADLPSPGIEPASPIPPALQADSLPTESAGKPEVNISAAHQILLILPSRHLLGLHLPTSYKCSYGQVTYFSKCSMTRSDMCYF